MSARRSTSFSLLILCLSACAQTSSSGGDRYRAVRGDGTPRPSPPLAIANPPSVQFAANENEKPIVPAVEKTISDQPNLILPVNATLPAPIVIPAKEPVKSVSDPQMFQQLHAKAASRWANIDSYIVRLKRREVVAGKAMPEEWMLMKYRKEPKSVYLKWVGEHGKGRECIFVPDRYEGKIQTLLAANDVPFMPAGMRFAVLPDSVMVRSKCRYSITEIGFASFIQRFGSLVEANERGDTRWGSIKYLGKVQRPEYEQPMDAVLQTIPVGGSDSLFPQGGQRQWFFDQHWNLPMLMVAQDERGREVEYYCHDRFEYPVHLDDQDFNPEFLWTRNKSK